ncbi:16S rRNA (guanine(527)-N(7))-methyltransferase RsmG, partial [Xanthomonas citri pv. citri]|nr:16S rRNA (guanine(527)-N(7))-methyltransferase RsmG [Xanthomonas citri pv. citri]
FASLNDMVDWCYHLPNPQGKFYALKGIYAESEVQEIKNPIRLEKVIPLSVPELVGERHLVLLNKPN